MMIASSLQERDSSAFAWSRCFSQLAIWLGQKDTDKCATISIVEELAGAGLQILLKECQVSRAMLVTGE